MNLIGVAGATFQNKENLMPALNYAAAIDDLCEIISAFALARIERGMSQRELAQKCGVQEADIKALEEGVDGKILTMVLAARELGIGINLSKLAVLNITGQPVK